MSPDRIAAAIRHTSRPPVDDHGPTRKASVALVFRPATVGPLPDLLMIKRAEHAGDPWSGHMAFPGGRAEGEEDALQAAVRETSEELALDLGPARVLGPLRPVVGPRLRRDKPSIYVDATVFWLEQIPRMTPNREVAEVHWFGLNRFMSDEGRATFPFTWRGNQVKMPCHRLDGRTIWGMSLSMIDDLVDRIRVLQG